MAALTEEQTLIKDQATSWVNEQAPVQKFRAMRDSGVETRFEGTTWQGMVEMGWPGIIVPEAYGGTELGFLTFGLVLEQTGRQLTASPLLSSGLAGASALLLGGTEAQKNEHLPNIVEGKTIATLAVDEGPRHNPARTAMQAEADGAAYKLTGRKSFVPEGGAANLLVVAARTSGKPGDEAGISLFLVSGDAAGLSRATLTTSDSRGYANIEFDGVAAELLGEVDAGWDLLNAILDRARAGMAAEMLGCASQAFDMTLEYLKTREQFGQVIGSFQALGHRAAGLFTKMELTRSCVEAALQALDSGADDTAELCSLAKCRAGAFLFEMSNQLIQIHGGIGMTDEFDAGFYLKRARAQDALYGNQAFHRDRYATLVGF